MGMSGNHFIHSMSLKINQILRRAYMHAANLGKEVVTNFNMYST